MKQVITGQIVSPPFACGLPWLVNVLLELDIQMTSGEFEAGCAEHSVLWGSRMDWARYPDRRTILFVRDPRDALYASYLSQNSIETSFEQFLFRPAVWSPSFPTLLKMAPADTYAYFALFWMAMSKVMNVSVVRYEDVGKNPVASVSHMVSYLGFERTQEQINQALKSSADYSGEGAHDGWKQSYNQQCMDLMDGLPNYFMHLQGYEIVSKYNYADVARKVPRAIEEMSDVLKALLKKIQRLDKYRDAQMVRKSILGTASVFSQTSMERALTALFLQAYDWTEILFPLGHGHGEQRAVIFKVFCEFNMYFLGAPSALSSMQDIFDELDVKLTPKLQT